MQPPEIVTLMASALAGEAPSRIVTTNSQPLPQEPWMVAEASGHTTTRAASPETLQRRSRLVQENVPFGRPSFPARMLNRNCARPPVAATT